MSQPLLLDMTWPKPDLWLIKALLQGDTDVVATAATTLTTVHAFMSVWHMLSNACMETAVHRLHRKAKYGIILLQHQSQLVLHLDCMPGICISMEC